jgi:hypothetical protein
MHNYLFLLLLPTFLSCDLINHGCSECESPSLVLTFIDSGTKQKIALSRLTIIHNSTDTVQYLKTDITNSIWQNVHWSDSSYTIMQGTGKFTLIAEDTIFGKSTFENINVVDDKSSCKRIYTKYIEIELTGSSLEKKSNNSRIVSQYDKLGC